MWDLLNLSGPMNHVLIREPGVVGDDPGHARVVVGRLISK